MTSTISLEAAAVLATARADRHEADAAEARLLQRALEWADLHRVEPHHDAHHDGSPATAASTFGDIPVTLAGPGAPAIAQFAVFEFGADLGMSRRAAEMMFADVLELAYRLPRTWARLTSGQLKAWRARQIASATGLLSPEAAAHVDAQVAPFANRVGPAELQRLIDGAIARFMPAYAEQIAAQAEESQFLTIDFDQPSYTGTCRISGELDIPDALDLEQAVQAGAAQQRDLGFALPLDARRAKALGNLARGELVLDYNSGLPETAKIEGLTPPTVLPRRVDLYLHLPAQAVQSGTDTGATGTGTGHLKNRGGHLVTADQIRKWCRTAGSATPSSPRRPDSRGETGGQSRRTARLKAWRGAASHPRAPHRSRGDTARPLAEVALGDGLARATTDTDTARTINTTASRPSATGPTPASPPPPTSGEAPTATPSSQTAPAPKTSPPDPSNHRDLPEVLDLFLTE